MLCRMGFIYVAKFFGPLFPLQHTERLIFYIAYTLLDLWALPFVMNELIPSKANLNGVLRAFQETQQAGC